MRTYDDIGLAVPAVLLPRKGIDLAKWAVIAVDQFTSEPEYWDKVRDMVNDAPSTLNLIYPEVYLGERTPESRVHRIQATMRRYLEEGLFEVREGFVYVERQAGPRTRRGLLVCLDLERYDYRPGSQSLIRASEGTILDRIPPRVKIREGAPLELPHIMVLIDDPENSVLGPLAEQAGSLEKLYDFELMMGSGRVAGYWVKSRSLEHDVAAAMDRLADAGLAGRKYGTAAAVCLYAMGDGNHSLASAKTIWDKTKQSAAESASIWTSPLRHALVELVNLYDPALIFGPIHRVFFKVAPGQVLRDALSRHFQGRVAWRNVSGLEEVKQAVDSQTGLPQKVGYLDTAGYAVVELLERGAVLPVATLQPVLDQLLADKVAESIDYVHGTASLEALGRKPGNCGFYLPAMNKTDLFKTLILDGALPRKTFSMGETKEKRFYIEARKLS